MSDIKRSNLSYTPGLSQLAFAHRLTYKINANWKSVVGNFLQCYHCSVAHKDDTIRPAHNFGFTMETLRGQLTRAEYLVIDEASPDKHQFYQGEIFVMSGGSFNHAAIAGNIYSSLRGNNNSCQPMNSDMRVSTPTGLDTYPDVSVYCGEPELTDNDCTLLNPVLIVEVLSPSTRNYDRSDKFENYRSIPSLQDFLLVDSEKVHIEHFQRQGDTQWLLSEYWQADDKLVLESVGLAVSVQEIYLGTKFSKQ